MTKSFFVSGTDTDAGKTLVATAILHRARAQGLSTLGLKPVASGCQQTEHGLRNADALSLQQASSIELDYEQINPLAFEPAIAPHIAAQQLGKRIQVDRLAGYCRGALFSKPDLCLIEGAGGWRVPLNEREDFSALPKVLAVPVVLVVGIKLGCINHALLTAEAIAGDGVAIVGWVANRLEKDMHGYEENVQTLTQRLRLPLIAEIPFLANPSAAAAAGYINLAPLLG